MDRPESRSRAKSRAKDSRNVALRSSWQLVTQHRSSYRQQELGQVVRTKNEILRKNERCFYNYVPRFQTDVFVCPMWSLQRRFVGFVGRISQVQNMFRRAALTSCRLAIHWETSESTRQTTQNRGRMKTPENNEQQQQANYQNRSFYLK